MTNPETFAYIPPSARQLLTDHGLPEDVIDGVLCLHAQELAAVQRHDAAVWGVDTAAGKHRLDAADLIDPTRAPAAVSVPAPAPQAADRDTAPADWIDGHPQLEAIAAAVWERYEHHGSGLIVDDPRNIAVAAYAAVLAVLPEPADQAAALNRAADAVFALDYDVMVGEEGDENLGSMREAWDLGTIHATELLRRLAAEAPTTTKPETATEAPADRGTLRRKFGDVLRHWGLLDEQIDQKAAEEYAVTDLLALLPEQTSRDAETEHLRDRLTSCRERVGIAADKAIAAEETIERARQARRRLTSALIAVEPLLTTPYPDDPRWSPWTRFVGPALKELSDALRTGPAANVEPAAGVRQDGAQPQEACGKDRSVDGTKYRPCALAPGHPEAYCQSADGMHLFLATGHPVTAEAAGAAKARP